VYSSDALSTAVGRRCLLALVAAVGSALFLAHLASGSATIFVGAAEDASKSADPAVAAAKMELAHSAGFTAVRLTTIWAPGQTAPTGDELLGLSNAVGAATARGIRVILSVYQFGSATTPLTPLARSQFADFTASLARSLPGVQDFIIGNEPNLNRFWLPQFNKDGSDAAAQSYEALLATTYDALKAVSGDIRVIGGSVSPRGGDDPHSSRPTHSPSTFIPDLGSAYKASGRKLPIMDAFAFHPYEENSSLPPTFSHPRSTSVGLNDYTKLVGLLTKAFDGTPQRGAGLPIVYDEFGVESQIPTPKALAYTGNELRGTRPVTEKTQGLFYAQSIGLAACQPTVIGLLFFHVSDEPGLDRWQSGVYYADDSAKASLPAVQQALGALADGSIACG
jgi:hypothetical protein